MRIREQGTRASIKAAIRKTSGRTPSSPLPRKPGVVPRGPASSNPARELASRLASLKGTGPDVSGQVLRDTTRDLGRRLSDPAWRTLSGPRAHLFDPCPAHPPEVGLLSEPGAVDAEAGITGLAPLPATGLAEADGAAQASTLAAQEEEAHRRAAARTAVLPPGSAEEIADTAARLAEARARTDATFLGSVNFDGATGADASLSSATFDGATGADVASALGSAMFDGATGADGSASLAMSGGTAGLGGSTSPVGASDADTTVDTPGAASEYTASTQALTTREAGTAPGGLGEVARLSTALNVLSGRGDVRITIRPASPGTRSPASATKPPPIQPDATTDTGRTDEAPPATPSEVPIAVAATKQLAEAHAQAVQGIQQGLGAAPDPSGVIPTEATLPAVLPATPPEPAAEAPVTVSPAPGPGPSTDDGALAAWKGRIASTTEKVPQPQLPPAPRYTFKVQQAAVDPNAVRAARLKQLEDEGKKAITPAKQPKDMPAIPDDPTGKASSLVDAKCDRRLEVTNATLPDLQRSPLGHVPEIGAQLMRDDGGHLLIKGPLGDLVYKPGGPKPTDPEKLKDWTLLEKKITDAAEKQKKAKVAPKEPAKGVTVIEEAAPAPINVPDFARVDIGDVLARLLAAPDRYADASVQKAREAYVAGGLDTSWGVGLIAEERPLFAAELQRIADAAQLKKEDLDAKVEARRKTLVDSHAATTDTLSKAHEEAKQSLEESGKTFNDALSRVRASLDAQAEAKAAAIKGGVDLTEARRKRDALLSAVDTKVDNWVVRYSQNGQRFKDAFIKAASDQMRAYELAALQDEWQLKKDAGEDPVKLKAATEAYRPTKKWLDDRRKEIGAVVSKAKRDIDQGVERYQDELRRAGKEAKEVIRDWHAQQIGYERGFWDRLLGWILDWLESAHDESKAWEAAVSAENKTSLDKNMLFLAEVRLRQGEELDAEALKKRQDLSEEQKAILVAYYGKGGKDPVQALAEGLAVRIAGQRRKPLMEALEKEILAATDLERVRTVVEAQKPQFSSDALNIVGKVEQGVNHTWGTEEKKIFDALANLTPVQGHYVELLYASRNGGENLRERLKSELDDFFSSTTHDWDKAEALLSGNAVKAAAVELDDAMHGGWFLGAGTDESAILTLLRGKTPEQIDAIKKAYKEKYNRDLIEELDSELRSGSLKTHDADEMHALVEGRTEDARAIELERAMRGSWFFGLGTDRQGIEAVYDRVRKETEADAQQYGWDSKTLKAELLKRNRDIDAAYERQYGKDWTERATGESALSAAYRDEMGGEELKLIEGMRDDKGLQVDAARIRIEHTSFFYADDKIIRGAMSAEGRRQIADERRDGYLDIQERLDIERELDEAKVKPASAGPLTDADRKKGFISELEFLEKWSPEKLQARLAKERKNVDLAAKAHAQEHAQANMQALAEEYDASYVTAGTSQMTFGQAVLFNTSGSDQDAVKALLAKGYLTDAEVVQFAVQGVGTDVDDLKEVFAGKSREEIHAIAEEWAKNNPPDAGDTRTPFERFRARIDEELSGREDFDILDVVVHGEAVTPREKLARARRREGFEQDSSNIFSRSSRKILEAQTATLEAEVAALELHESRRPKPGDKDYDADTLRKWQDDWEKKAVRIDHQAELADEAVTMHREQVDTVTDFVVTIATAAVMAIAVIIGVLLSIFAPPVGVGFWAAFGTFMASSTVLVGTALATVAVTMLAKAALKGSAYGWEEAATDAGVGAVDVLTSVATAGMGSKLLKMGFLARMAGEGGVMARMTAHGLAQGAEGLVQSVPSAFLGNVLNDDNYKGGNALLNVLAGTAMQAAPGALLSGGLGALGGISKPRMPPPHTHDLLAFRGTPQERLTLFKKWKVENPAGGMKEFLREFDDGLLKQMSGDFDKKQFQRTMRKELLEHVPPAQRKAFANTPIEMLSKEDFEALTGSKSAEAVTLFRRGRPTIVFKAGADLAALGEEGLHLLQRHDKATLELVRALDETALRHWERLPVEKQFELYRKKLLLEIDAQKSLLVSLEAKRGVSMDPGEAARRIERGERSLGNLRKRLGEVDAFTPSELAEFGQGTRTKPQYLKEPPRLFSKTETPSHQLELPWAKAPEVEAPKVEAPEVEATKPPAQPVTLTPGVEAGVWPQTAQVHPNKDIGAYSLQRPEVDDPLIQTLERTPLSKEQLKRTTMKLRPGESLAQVGPPWEELKFNRELRVTEKRYYRLVEKTDAQGQKHLLEEILSAHKNARWQVRGNFTQQAGDELEKVASLRMTESILGDRLGPGKEFQRVVFKPRGEQGSGFDELLFHFDDGVNPTRADIHIVEVKGGGEDQPPQFRKFTSVSGNLLQNLDMLREKLLDKTWTRTYQLGPAHIEAITKAIDEWQVQIELRVGPITKMPQEALTDRIDRVANAWRKLDLIERKLPPGSEDLALVDKLKRDLKASFAPKRVEDVDRALDIVEEALDGTTPGTGMISKHGIGLGPRPQMIRGLDPDAVAGAITRIDERFLPPPPVVTPPTLSDVANAATGLGETHRVRTVVPGVGVLGWGGFDISLSQQWSARRFMEFERVQLREIRDRLKQIPELDPRKFNTLRPLERKQALLEAAEITLEALGIPKSRRPDILFKNLRGDYGYMSWNFRRLRSGRLRPYRKRGRLVIANGLSVGDAVGTIVHESRHYYQAYQAYQLSLGRTSHPLAGAWAGNLPGSGGTYFIAGPRYYSQPIEADAETFGRRLIDLLPGRWPP
ncbi:annexin [Corallococcus terminator]|uniref:annexin n=1 Tax=Corallococcus terminator TaxID=2316733 RepID=UPI0013156D0C|nr:annexin [Corallococcus terminator]